LKFERGKGRRDTESLSPSAERRRGENGCLFFFSARKAVRAAFFLLGNGKSKTLFPFFHEKKKGKKLRPLKSNDQIFSSFILSSSNFIPSHRRGKKKGERTVLTFSPFIQSVEWMKGKPKVASFFSAPLCLSQLSRKKGKKERRRRKRKSSGLDPFPLLLFVAQKEVKGGVPKVPAFPVRYRRRKER